MRRFVIAVTVVCAAGSSVSLVAAQMPEADPIQKCIQKLVPYAGRPTLREPEWSLDLDGPNGGHLTYIGASHSRDPQHPQFARIQKAWEESRPTVAFYEGPARPIGASADETIRKYGESGYVRFLAQKSGARIERLEPPPPAELTALRERFSLEQIKLFYILRETTHLRDRQGLQGPELQAAVTQLMDRAQTALGEQFGAAWTLADLEAAYRRYWTEPAEWWQAPSRWFTPGGASSETGGIFTNDVNRASSEFRNRHMYTVLAQAVRRGERVFAAVGRDHVPAQAAALRCALSQRLSPAARVPRLVIRIPGSERKRDWLTGAGPQ